MTSVPDSVSAAIEVTLDPAAAFEVFTNEIDLWYQRGPYSWNFPEKAVGIRFEPGLGGRLIEVHDAATGEGFDCGRITAWEPGIRLVYAFTSLRLLEPLTEVEIRFEPVEHGTRVTWEHRGYSRLPLELALRELEGSQYGVPVGLRWFGAYVARQEIPMPEVSRA